MSNAKFTFLSVETENNSQLENIEVSGMKVNKHYLIYINNS